MRLASDCTFNENFLIKGNNLIALHSLKRRYRGKVKLIYIDPPYNTGNDSFNYNDRFNHSVWLSFMKNRLEVARELLRDDGVIFVQCNDNEQAYLKVLMDEIFHYRETIVVQTSTASGVNAVNVKRGEQMFKLKEYILFYSKSSTFRFNPLLIKSSFNDNYRYEVVWKNGEYSVTDLKKNMTTDEMETYCLENPENIFSLEKNNQKAGEKIKKVIEQSKINNKKVIEFENSFGKTVLVYNGGVFIPLKERIINEENKNFYGVLISDLWIDEIFQTSSSEGGVKFLGGKKTEKLIRRIIELSTQENDLVLDFFAGSGTTCAVAHKMKRRYIGIEQMNYIETITLERLKKVIDGEQGGISKAVGWLGGGSVIYAALMPLNALFKDKINKASTLDELNTVFQEMQEKAFLEYAIDREKLSVILSEAKRNEESLNGDSSPTAQNDEVGQNDKLAELKALLKTVLDSNMDYVLYGDIDDAEYQIDDETKAFNQAFYGA